MLNFTDLLFGTRSKYIFTLCNMIGQNCQTNYTNRKWFIPFCPKKERTYEPGFRSDSRIK